MFLTYKNRLNEVKAYAIDVVAENDDYLDVFDKNAERIKTFKKTNILSKDLFFSSFLIMGTTLKISPTLEPWNHISLPLPLFFENKQNFSLYLFLSSFFLISLKIIIKGDKIKIRLVNNL